MNIVVSNPWMMVVDDVLTKKECEAIINIGEKSFQPSDEMDRYKDVRTSGHTFIRNKDYCPAVQKLCDITSLISKRPEENAENGCIIKYLPGEQYKAHYDFFINGPEDQRDEKYHRCGDRILTVIYYLNDAYLGGTTDFPKINMKVHPKIGRALVFRNYVGDEPNMLSLHAGRTVTEGTKYIVTKWVREKHFSKTWREALGIEKPKEELTWESILGYPKPSTDKPVPPKPSTDDDCGCDDEKRLKNESASDYKKRIKESKKAKLKK